MNLKDNAITVAEIVTSNIKSADVFKKNGIDFCCGGQVSLIEVCQKNTIDYNQLIQELEHVLSEESNTHNFDSWDLDFLSDFIINTHHKYVSEASEMALQYAEKVARVHGAAHPEVVKIFHLLSALVDELMMHMRKEEMILFPYIKNLAQAKRTGMKMQRPPFGTIQNPINMMESEHDTAGDIIKQISTLSNEFKPPAEACNTYKALYSKLEEFQNDLFQHIHLENNILFPKAIAMESEIIG